MSASAPMSPWIARSFTCVFIGTSRAGHEGDFAVPLRTRVAPGRRGRTATVPAAGGTGKSREGADPAEPRTHVESSPYGRCEDIRRDPPRVHGLLRRARAPGGAVGLARALRARPVGA